jgi:hypothetical protein
MIQHVMDQSLGDVYKCQTVSKDRLCLARNTKQNIMK